MRYAFVTLLLLAPLAPLTPTSAQKNAKIPDPDPEVERKTFTVPEGFEVNLFAADPQLRKPIHMNFDAAGRLWVAASETYPQIEPGKKADDKIIVLEDTKGKGVADKVTVFADKLFIPTGLEPGDGGVYVANSTDLIHLSDPKDTGKATRRRVVLTGFGTEDTHHLLHTLRWGHDGNLYMNQSVYIHSHVETPFGPRRLNGGGVWQFRPDSQRLEVFVRGFWNSWGHHFDRFGTSFITDGAGGEGVAYGFPGAAFTPTPGAQRVLRGMTPGHPKYCGLELLFSSHFPPEWQGHAITCDFRAHRVCRFELTPSGSGFVARQMPDVIKSNHPAFRPIDVKVGPDGALYVADWYNPIIQHGEVDFRDPRRDVTRGRIWRVTAKNRPLVKRPDLTRATPAELCKHLESPEGSTRHFARRQLGERGAKTSLPALKAWHQTVANKAENEPHMLEALWTYQTLGEPEPALLSSLLAAKDGRVRAAAVRVLAAWREHVKEPLSLLEPRANDDHPQARLEAVRALAAVGGPRAAELALRALEKPIDTYLDYAIWLTMRELEGDWLPALQAGRFDYGGNVRLLTFALEAVGSAKVVPPLVKLVNDGKLSPEASAGVLALLAGVGGPGELDLVVRKAAAEKDLGTQARLLYALEESARQRNARPAGEAKRVVELLDGDDAVRPTAARLAGLWGVAEARPKLTALATDARAKPGPRRAALEGLASLGGKDSAEAIGAVAEKEANAEVRRAALVSLAGLDAADAASKAVSLLEGMKTGDGANEVYEAFLARKDGAGLLAKAVAGKKLPADVAKVGVRSARISGRPDNGLIDALTKAGGLTFGARTLTANESKELAAEVAEKGDPARGEKVFRRADQLCLKCHAIGGAGGSVGPDLAGIGAGTQVDYLIESLLVPSKAIKENFHSTLVTTKRGRQYTGIKVRQTDKALVLRNDQDQEVTVPLSQVEEQTPSKTSLMPDGLTDVLTRGELVDLVSFLGALGKSARWSVGTAKVARRWQAAQDDAGLREVLAKSKSLLSLAGSAAGVTWEPAYSGVDGTLPLEGLPRFGVGKDGPEYSAARAQLSAATAATARLRVNGAEGLTAWLDGEPLALDGGEVRLRAGAHVLTVVVRHAARKEGLRVEIEDVPAAAGVRFVGGK